LPQARSPVIDGEVLTVRFTLSSRLMTSGSKLSHVVDVQRAEIFWRQLR
jgi:hypothetical protein